MQDSAHKHVSCVCRPSETPGSFPEPAGPMGQREAEKPGCISSPALGWPTPPHTELRRDQQQPSPNGLRLASLSGIHHSPETSCKLLIAAVWLADFTMTLKKRAALVQHDRKSVAWMLSVTEINLLNLHLTPKYQQF